MSEEDRRYLRLRDMAANLFVKNGANLTMPNVIAAITAAASYMALAGDIATKGDTHDIILEAFCAKDIDFISKMAETLGTSDVESLIGYSVDFLDYGVAKASYDAQKDSYDALYNEVNSLIKGKARTL